MIVGGQSDVTFFRVGSEVFPVAVVQLFDNRLWRSAAAHTVENPDKRFVLLPIDGFQFDGHIVNLLQGMASEEIGRVVVSAQDGFVFSRDYRGELLQIANHHQLNASERSAGFAIATQYGVDGIKQIAPHHGYLVDNQQVECADDAAFLLSEIEFALDFCVWDKR